MIPEWKKINSGHLEAVCYNESKKELLIRFKNKTVYKYSKVEKHEFEPLKKEVSAGKYFATHIKTKKPSKKIE